MISLGRGAAVVLDIDHWAWQFSYGWQQAEDIGRVLPDGGFVEYVQQIFQAAGEGDCQSNSL
jgi:hypothetical protein